jgi:hypothetical protein
MSDKDGNVGLVIIFLFVLIVFPFACVKDCSDNKKAGRRAFDYGPPPACSYCGGNRGYYKKQTSVYPPKYVSACKDCDAVR